MKKFPARRTFALLYAIHFVLCSARLAAQAAPNQAVVVNPKPGVWANKQTLALNVPDGCDAFYSIGGSDPLTSGFAYDGPVVIDAEGDVTMRLATVAKDNTSVEQTVSYRVESADVPAALSVYAQGAVFRLNAASKIELPANLKYCLGSDTEPKFDGRTLSLSAFYPSRLVPCTVSDGERRWRFVVSIEVPRAADGTENSAPETRQNAVPPAFLPKFDLVLDDGRYMFRAYFSEDRTAREDGYTFTAPEAGITEPVHEIPVDALFGEEISSSIAINAYYRGVFQGVVSVPYMLDRRPPDVPLIASAAPPVGRGPASVKISQNTPDEGERDMVFYAVESFTPDDSVFQNRALDAKNLPQQPNRSTVFSRLQDDEIFLGGASESNSAGAVVYAVFAYAEDASGNKSDYAVFHVFIDTANFFLVPAADAAVAPEETPDGSITNPFTSFDQALGVIKRINGARLHIQGEWTVQKTIELTSACSIFGNGKTRIKFADDAQLVVKNTSFSAQSVVFEKNSPTDSGYITPVAVINGATARFTSCTFAVSATGSKALFSATKSTLDFDTCLFSLSASGYGTVVSGNGCEVSVRDSMIVLNAATAVGFSLEDSTFTLSNSRVRAIAPLARIAELARSTFRITGNVFTIDSDTPIWYDRASVPAAYINNTIGE
jgi:hypothetical protein